ncbi:hypothetical protein ACOMHN_011620 [Nucella lapillus]
MATIMVDTINTKPLYPRLYPTLESCTSHFTPFHPQQREGEEVRHGEEERGLFGVNGERKEKEGEEKGETLETTDLKDGGCASPAVTVTSPSKASPTQGSADTGETSTETGNAGEQTTNTDVTMTDSADCFTPEGRLQRGEAPEVDRLAKREDYVDRVWEEFVTHFLLGSCHIQKAAIFDLASRRLLAMNGNLRISEEELEQLVTSLQYLQLAYRNGVTLEGKTYKVRLADGRNGILARTDREGCTVCQTHTLVIIGVHDETGNSRKCNEDVMRLGDFFRKKAV